MHGFPQGDYIELHQKRHGRRPDHDERKRKRAAREVHKRSEQARKLLGAKGKRFAKKRYAEKAQMKKTNTIKQKRKEKAGKWDVPLPKKKRCSKSCELVNGKWKRMVTKATFVGPGFTRKPPKYERFIRPTGLRFTKAHVNTPKLLTIRRMMVASMQSY
nr:unnamed protein product [Digitaria exilis]